MDGAGEWWIILRIIAPLSRMPLAALAIFTFLGTCNDYLFPVWSSATRPSRRFRWLSPA